MMGRHHLRVCSQLTNLCEVVGVYDCDRMATDRAAQEFGAYICKSLGEAIHRSDVVYIATPTSSHYAVAKQAIQSQRHVFIEKPIANDIAQAEELNALASQNAILIGVGHTERFNPVVIWLAQHLSDEEILSINIERVGPRPPRIKDVGIITDLAVHDLDLVAFLSRSPIRSVRCMGKCSQGQYEDVAQIVLSTENCVVGSIHTNWLTPFKSRRIRVATTRALFRGDLLRGVAEIYTALDESSSRYSVEEAVIRGSEPLVAQAQAFFQYLKVQAPSSIVTGKEAIIVLNWVQRCLSDLTLDCIEKTCL
jgi:predicted dehydrogenase